MELYVNVPGMCLLIFLYRVSRNLQHFQSDVYFVAHIKEWQVENKACRKVGGGFDLRTHW